MKLDWFDDGNLLILLPEPLLTEWHGIDSEDYDRACKVSETWLNRIPVQASHGLLLGGDAGMVHVATGKDGAVVLIRWVHANDENELVEFVLQGKPAMKSEPELVFNNIFAKWWLFNAASNSSSDKRAMKSIELPLGYIHVETLYYQGELNAAIVHKFRANV